MKICVSAQASSRRIRIVGNSGFHTSTKTKTCASDPTDLPIGSRDNDSRRGGDSDRRERPFQQNQNRMGAFKWASNLNREDSRGLAIVRVSVEEIGGERGRGRATRLFALP